MGVRQANGRRRAPMRVLGLLVLCAPALAGTHASGREVLVHAGALLDGAGAPARRQVSILIRDDRIVSVEPGFADRAGAAVIDLADDTVMPGFIDCHIHLSAPLPGRMNEVEDTLTHNAIDFAFRGAANARRMLQQGFTSARDVGGGDETVAIRNAVDAGYIAGPRLWVSLEPLSPTAGHGDPRSGLDPALEHRGWDSGIVDSPDQARYRVREHKRRGANLIKLLPSGGIASTGDDPNAQLMTDDEIRVAVETAHGLGMKVAAHAYPPTAIEHAVLAGVDSIEHGSFATARTFALMKAHGTVLVPTLTVYDTFYAVARDHPEQLAPGTAPKEMANDLLPARNLALAIRSDVTIAYGTDIGEGDHSREFTLLIQNGMSPAAALVAATRNAAALIGASADIGAVAPGHYADLVAVRGDPLAQPALFNHADFVMKGGIVYREHAAPTAVGGP